MTNTQITENITVLISAARLELERQKKLTNGVVHDYVNDPRVPGDSILRRRGLNPTDCLMALECWAAKWETLGRSAARRASMLLEIATTSMVPGETAATAPRFNAADYTEQLENAKRWNAIVHAVRDEVKNANYALKCAGVPADVQYRIPQVIN